MAVTIMISFARSGGTVLNQCLGSLPDVVILSEVNPLGGGWGEKGASSLTTIHEQAQAWYQIELKSREFVPAVIELEEICSRMKKHLVLRDWSFSNFFPHQVNNFNPPNRLLTLEALSGRCDLKPFVFLRDAIDVWISRGMPPAGDFFQRYRQYAKSVQQLPVFKYEDFCQEPARVIREICDLTDLPYAESWRNYRDFNRVHGDVQGPYKSRGARRNRIQPLPRKWIPEDRRMEVNGNQDMLDANQVFGYSSSYAALPGEGFFSFLVSRTQRKAQRAARVIKDLIAGGK